MLKTRILTALVLLPMMVAALFLFDWFAWASFTGLITFLGLREWARLAQFSPKTQWIYAGLGVSVLGGGGVVVNHISLSGIAFLGGAVLASVVVLVFWLLVVPCWLYFRWRMPRGVWAALLGMWTLGALWAALLLWRPDTAAAWRLLALMALVWVADSAAYFVGRRWGRRKLAPEISPGKTWEGVVGAWIAVTLYTLGLAYAGILGEVVSWGGVLVLAWILTAVSIMGDLLESLFKRQAGLKDSSQLLPGHGGVLDRIDSLIAVLPVAAALLLLLA